MNRTSIVRSLAVLICLSLAASPAQAVDGRLEIHQACVATGCFPGDGPGFPVEITASGSYLLTSNLAVSDPNVNGIEIAVGGVTLDLNGHELAGPSTCSHQSPCAPAGSGVGIRDVGSQQVFPPGNSVLNGAVRGFPDSGIRLQGSRSRIHAVWVHANHVGIFANTSSLVSDNRVVRNASIGIIAGGRISGNTVVVNGSTGINTQGPSVVESNVIASNVGAGIIASSVDGTGYRSNVLAGNNGGNANPQVGPSVLELGPNLCGGDAICP